MHLEREKGLTVGLKERICSFKSKSKYETPFLLVEHRNANVYLAYTVSSKKDRNCLHRSIFLSTFGGELLHSLFYQTVSGPGSHAFWLVRLQSK